MNTNAQKLSQLLQLTTRGTISSMELAELVHMCRVIVQAHLETHRQSVVRLALHHGLTVTDVAYDCIAEAFARSHDGAFVQLKNFEAALQCALEQTPPHEVFLAFKSFLVKVADAQLARLYAQADPVGARIYRNIREHLRVSEALQMDRDFRGLVLRPRGLDCLDHLQAFPPEQIQRVVADSHTDNIPVLLRHLGRTLCAQRDYRRSVPLIEVVTAIKKNLASDPELIGAGHEKPEFVGLGDDDIDKLRHEVDVAIKEKVLMTYLIRGKVGTKQAEAMASAMHDLLWDWCFGDGQKGLIDYLRAHWNIAEEEYEDTMRTKMEYLLRLAREEFEARLMREI